MIFFVLFPLEASQPRMDFNIFKFFYWGHEKSRAPTPCMDLLSINFALTRLMISKTNLQFKVDRLQIIVVAEKYIYASQLFIGRMPKMRQ